MDITESIKIIDESNINEKQKEDLKESNDESVEKVAEEVGEKEADVSLLTVPVSEKENSLEVEKKSPEIATLFEMAANSTHNFKGFSSFRGFGRLDISQFNQVVSLTQQKIFSDDALKTTEVTNDGAVKITIEKNSRKKKKKWSLKKRPRIPKAKTSDEDLDCDNDLFDRLYRKCLDVTNSDSGESGTHEATAQEGVFSSPILDVEPLLGMAVEVINKLKRTELQKKQEKILQQQNQKSMLQKIIKLLKERVPPTNGDTDYEKLLPQQLPSVEPSRVSRLKKLKANFYGFRSVKPQTRDRGGLITVEKLFANSPPGSPIHDGQSDNNDSAELSFPPTSSKTVRKLDFVVEPLNGSVEPSNGSSHDAEFNSADNPPVTRNGIIRERRQQVHQPRRLVIKNNRTLVHISKVKEGLSSNMKSLNNKILNRRKLISRLKNKKGNEISKSSQLEDKLKVEINEMPKLRVKSLFTHRPKRNDSSQVHARELSEKNETNSVAECKMLAPNPGFSFRGFTGPFGSPKKSDAERAFSNVSVSSTSSVKSKVPLAVGIRGLKRKFNQSLNKKEDTECSKILGTSNDIKLSRSSSVDANNVDGIQRMQPVDKFKPIRIQSTSNVSMNHDTSSNRNNIELHPNKLSEILPSNNTENSILYYPVHPFISHDLPVHFIPVNASEVPPYFPLYSPGINFKSASPIYPSFIRTRPSTEQKSPSEYVLLKGIRTNSIPRRSFAEDKVRENLFCGIASVSKCPLFPENSALLNKNKRLSDTEQKSDVAVDIPRVIPDVMKSPKVTSHTNVSVLKSLPNGSENSLLPNTNSSGSLNKKVHKCLQCDFVTPKLGVFKRHELIHSKGNSVHKEVVPETRIQNTRSSPLKNPSSGKASILRHSNTRAKKSVSSVFRAVNRSSVHKTVKRKLKSSKSVGQKNGIGELKTLSVASSLVSRFPNVTVTPIYSKSE